MNITHEVTKKVLFAVEGDSLKGADLSGADLQEADLRNADLSEANLRGADLSRAKMKGANLTGVDLEGVNLYRADLRNTDLSGANLREADLRFSNLRGADLQGADLQGANLRWADLHGADLRGADLHKANLTGAKMQGANLLDVNLKGTKLPSPILCINNLKLCAVIFGGYITIDCHHHKIEDWKGFDDATIEDMGNDVVDFWREHKETIFQKTTKTNKENDMSHSKNFDIECNNGSPIRVDGSKLSLKVFVYLKAAGIDYNWDLNVEGIECCEDEDAAYILDWLDVSHLKEGLVAMNTKNLDKRINEMKELALESYRYIGKRLGTEYDMTARFSNGETIYSKNENSSEPEEVLDLLLIAA